MGSSGQRRDINLGERDLERCIIAITIFASLLDQLENV